MNEAIVKKGPTPTTNVRIIMTIIAAGKDHIRNARTLLKIEATPQALRIMALFDKKLDSLTIRLS